MKAQITKKIDSKIEQIVWENEVMYLETKSSQNGIREYSISLLPESKEFPNILPKGILDSTYKSTNIKKQLEANKNLIDRNIEFLTNIKEIFSYIEELENNDEGKLKNIENWKKTGLLDGLHENQISELAEYLEHVASFLINNLVLTSLNYESEPILFAVIRQIYNLMIKENFKKGIFQVNCRDLLRHLEKRYKDFKMISNEEEYHSLQDESDKEASFIHKFCIDYVNDLKEQEMCQIVQRHYIKTQKKNKNEN